MSRATTTPSAGQRRRGPHEIPAPKARRSRTAAPEDPKPPRPATPKRERDLGRD